MGSSCFDNIFIEFIVFVGWIFDFYIGFVRGRNLVKGWFYSVVG